MEKSQILKTLKQLREKSPKRKFLQTVDLIIQLKGLDLKKPEQKVETFMSLPHPINKPVKICALIDKQLEPQAKKNCDKVILLDEFKVWQNNKKEQKKLAKEYNFFIAQSTIMTNIASVFGKVLGPRGKMPSPKAGCIVPPALDLKLTVEKLRNLIKIQTKNELSIKIPVAVESMKDDEIVENIMAVYANLLNYLPQEKNNISSILIKLTMGPVFKIGEKNGD